MSKNATIVGVIVIIAIVLLGAWWVMSQNSTAPSDQESPLTQTNTTQMPKTHEVMYTNSGYSPSTLTIKVGDTVIWKNQSSSTNWVGSAMHPTHIVYSGTNLQMHCPDPENNDFDQCKADKHGDFWSFTFTKTGEWGYHNHMNAAHFAKIIVE